MWATTKLKYFLESVNLFVSICRIFAPSDEYVCLLSKGGSVYYFGEIMEVCLWNFLIGLLTEELLTCAHKVLRACVRACKVVDGHTCCCWNYFCEIMGVCFWKFSDRTIGWGVIDPCTQVVACTLGLFRKKQVLFILFHLSLSEDKVHIVLLLTCLKSLSTTYPILCWPPDHDI